MVHFFPHPPPLVPVVFIECDINENAFPRHPLGARVSSLSRLGLRCNLLSVNFILLFLIPSLLIWQNKLRFLKPPAILRTAFDGAQTDGPGRKRR